MNTNVLEWIFNYPLYKYEKGYIYALDTCLEYKKLDVDPKIYLDYIKNNVTEYDEGPIIHKLPSSLLADKWNYINNVYCFYPYSLGHWYSKTNIARILEISKNWYEGLITTLYNFFDKALRKFASKYDYVGVIPQSINRKHNILLLIKTDLPQNYKYNLEIKNNPYYPPIKNIRKLEDKLTCSFKKFSVKEFITLDEDSKFIEDNSNILLIDDVINTWASMVWVASKIKEINPKVNIDALWLIGSVKNETISEI